MHFSKIIGLLLFSLFLSLTEQSIYAQEVHKRDLTRYRQGGTFDLGYSFTSGHATEEQASDKAREFLWDNWQQKRLAYFIIRFRNTEGDPTTVNYYIEPDAAGCWRIVSEWESWCCWYMAMEGKEKERSSGTEFYYNVERVDATTRKPIPEQEIRKPESYRLLLSAKTPKGAETDVKIL